MMFSATPGGIEDGFAFVAAVGEACASALVVVADCWAGLKSGATPCSVVDLAGPATAEACRCGTPALAGPEAATELPSVESEGPTTFATATPTPIAAAIVARTIETSRTGAPRRIR